MSGFYNNKEQGKNIRVKDEGITLTPAVASIDITGVGVTATNIGDNVTQDVPGGGSSINFSDNEIPTGDINGVNTDFVLAHTPNPTTSLMVYVNGQRMKLTDDYTLNTATISLVTAPPTGSLILCDYRY